MLRLRAKIEGLVFGLREFHGLVGAFGLGQVSRVEGLGHSCDS